MTAFRPFKLFQATLLVALVPALAVAATPAAAPSPQAAIAQRQAGYKKKAQLPPGRVATAE